MTRVEAQPQPLRVEAAELADGVLRGLDDAAGLRLEPDPDSSTRLVGDVRQPAGERLDLARPGIPPIGRPRRPPRQRQGRDAAPHRIVGQERGQDPREVDRVPQSFRIGPVGQVDGALDDRIAEAAVREAVERHHLQPTGGELGPEARERRGIAAQRGRDVSREPQPEAQAPHSESLADRLAEAAELADDAVEVLGTVDVRAVGEVDDGAIGVPEPHRYARAPRRIVLPAYVAARSGATSASSSLPLWP